ncbi:MAG: glutathione transferase [Hydrogenophaga sp.]|nr:glutathione transferase [Hydrogenophaga sp.]
MRLYVDSQFASPYAMSAFVALRTKGLSFEVMPLDLAASQNATAEYKETSLTGRVPTLVCDGFALSESSAIAEYLEELHPLPRLYPSNPQARARARQVQAWLRSDLLALRQDRSTEVIFYGPTDAPLSPAGEVAAQKLLQAASALLTHGGDHLFGEWCIADLDLTVMLNRLVLNGDPVPEALASYARRQWQLPAA